MKLNQVEDNTANSAWGPYPNYDDIARLEYGQRMWRHDDMRRRLLAHWRDKRHPHRERFAQHREQVELALNSSDTDEALNRHFLTQGTSLRCVAREIPPVFGHFFPNRACLSSLGWYSPRP